MNVRKRLTALLIILSPTFAVSCLNRGASDPLSVKYVNTILSDTTSAGFARLKTAGCDGKSGSICIFGPADETFVMAEKFLTCDDYDNVTGRRIPDGLPDFAGECIAVVSDIANAPYQGYIDLSNEEYLRESTVKCYIHGIDSLCALSQYDRENSVRKRSAKVFVLSSPYLSAYGYRDIQAAVNATGGKVKVISPIHSMFDAAVRRHGNDASIAVWTTSERLGAGICSSVLSGLADNYPAMTYEILCPVHEGDVKERIMSFLRLYKASGQNSGLDAVLVDDMPLSATELNAGMKDIIENGDDSLFVYTSLLAEGFEFIGAGEAVAGECIRYLRESNQFTHKVAYPSAEFYTIAPVPGLSAGYTDNGDFTGSFKYNRAPSSDIMTFLMVKSENRSLQDSIAACMRHYAPKTFELYVSK